MNGIKIIGRGKYLPKKLVTSKMLAKNFNTSEEYIFKVCGISDRWYCEENETIESMAYNASVDAIENSKIEKNDIDLIIVATTSSNKMMPGISYDVQRLLDINGCFCLDVLAGCNGFVNAFDIAYNYLYVGKANTALIIGVDKLSDTIDRTDMSTAILFGDGAGATIIKKTEENKAYYSNIKSRGQDSKLLTYEIGKNIQMDGTGIYKYAVTEVPKIIKETLSIAKMDMEDLNHIVLHQSNSRIMSSIAKKLGIGNDKIYTNINKVGNTFCASIPIALTEIEMSPGKKLLMCGYGGGLNTGCIILEE